MKAPARVLLISAIVCGLVVLLVCYRYDLLNKGEANTVMTPETPPAASTAPTTPPPAPAAAVTSAPVQTQATGPAPEQLANGKKLFQEKTCVLCHGVTGKADTPTGQAMKASDLTSGNFAKNKQNIPPVAYILQVIENGVPGTGMASFKAQIPDEKDRKDLAEYVRSLSTK